MVFEPETTVPHKRVPNQIDPETACIHVIDAQGLPVQGAAFVDSAGIGRIFHPQGTGVLGVSDNEGLIHVPSAKIQTATALVVVSESRLPCALDKSALDDGQETIMLAEGHEQAIHCVDGEGAPVGGLRLALSMAAMPSEVDARSGLQWPGVGNDSIHVALTDTSGKAVFRGLGPGPHALRLLSDQKAILAGYPTEEIDVPRDPVDLVIGTLVAAVCRVESGRVSAYRILAPDPLRVGGLAHDEIGELSRRLKATFPEDIPFAALSAIEEPPNAQLRLLLEDGSLVDQELELRPVREGVIPQVVRASSMGDPCEPLEFDIMDGAGRIVPVSGFKALLGRNLVEGMLVPLHSGKDNWLPRGSYKLSQSNPWIERAMLTSRDFDVPGDVVVHLDGLFGLCRVVCLDHCGNRIQPITLFMQSAGISKEFLLTGSELEIWLPSGEVEIQVKAFGYEPHASVFTVSEGWLKEQILEARAGVPLGRKM